jgi:DNA repair protein RecN (Recombination protein N)
MLLSLTIKDFVIVSHLSLDCTAGLTVLSGETGAGKSILIDALSLCMGERSDASMVREGADAAHVTAEFEVRNDTRALLQSNALPCEELIIRRVVYRNGKSRALVNETPVTATLLKALADCLIDIHGQHAFQSLVRADEQRRLLDAHAGLLAQCLEVREAWRHWQALDKLLQQAIEQQDQIASERERLAWQLDEIDKVAPAPGQWEDLCQQHARLANAAELLDGAQSALDLLTDAEPSLSGQLTAVASRLTQLTRKDESLGEIVRLLNDADIQVQEAARSLGAYLRQVDLDPQRLTEVDERLSRWHTAARKMRIAPETLAEKAEEIRLQLSELDRQVDTDALSKQVKTSQAAFLSKATDLKARRSQAAQILSKAVSASMQGLNLTGGVFVCDVREADPSANGIDHVEFLVAGHAGVTPRALAKVASGGELARISLAISVITSQSSTIPTLIFDEVDSGIGGAVAETVGKYLRQLAAERQVLCVTHLPQVASQGHTHWRVSKAFDGKSTHSRIDVLDEAARIGEIARMLGGQTITENTRATAREMLGQTG